MGVKFASLCALSLALLVSCGKNKVQISHDLPGGPPEPRVKPTREVEKATTEVKNRLSDLNPLQVVPKYGLDKTWVVWVSVNSEVEARRIFERLMDSYKYYTYVPVDGDLVGIWVDRINRYVPPNDPVTGSPFDNSVTLEECKAGQVILSAANTDATVKVVEAPDEPGFHIACHLEMSFPDDESFESYLDQKKWELGEKTKIKPHMLGIDFTRANGVIASAYIRLIRSVKL